MENNNFNTPERRAYAPRVIPPFHPTPPKFWQIVLKDLALTVVGVTLFFVFLFFFFAIGAGILIAVAGKFDSSGNSFTETTIRGNDRCKGKIVVVPIEGVIETDETGFLVDAVKAIREDSRVRAVVLRINSPGGTISGSDYYLHLLKEMKKDLDIPIVVSMGDMATSGGYYISTVADKIVAERSTTTGSIGVIISMYNAAELCKKLGVRSNAITSGKMKGMGNFMKEPTPEETALWQKMVDDGYEQFLQVVKEGRAYYRGEDDAELPTREQVAGVKIETRNESSGEELEAKKTDETSEAETVAETEESETKTDDGANEVAEETEKVELDPAQTRDKELRELADGRIYSAQDALDLHLVDEIGFLDDAIDEAAKLAGLDKKDVEVVRFKEEVGFFESVFSTQGKQDPIDKALKTISTPKGYYICPRVLP